MQLAGALAYEGVHNQWHLGNLSLILISLFCYYWYILVMWYNYMVNDKANYDYLIVIS